MRLRVLFWNCNSQEGSLMKKEPDDAARAQAVARLVESRAVDLLVLCECAISSAELLRALKTEDSRFEIPLDLDILDQPGRFKFFCRFPGSEMEPFGGDDRLDVRRLRRNGSVDVLLAAFHFMDGWNNSPEKQHASLDFHKEALLNAECKAGHRRTVLFGDLNMNPFHIGMLDPDRGLGAMMTWDLAEAHSQLGTGGPHRFYNPMWSAMGRQEAPGTYYWSKDDPKNPYWNCIDGVLLRPELRNVFVDDSLCIVTTIPDRTGAHASLFRKARKHWHIEYSDHLPILFDLELPHLQEHSRE